MKAGSIAASRNQLILGSGTGYGCGSGREVIALPADKLMHTWCAGKSGYGKSYWLCSLFVMLLSRGVNSVLIDPSGDLSRLALKQLIALGYFDHHPDPFSKLMYLDLPAALKQDRYLPFNVLNVGHDPFTT